MTLKRRFLIPFFIFILFFVFAGSVYADSCSAVSECVSQNLTCSQCVDYLTSKKNELTSKARSLSSEIGVMDNQIKLTEARIEKTKQDIEVLLKDIGITEGKVSNLEKDIGSSSKALLGRIAAVYEIGRADPWQIFLTSSNISSFMTRLKYLKIVQIYDKRKVYAAEQSKVNYENQQDILEEKQKEAEELNIQLEEYTAQLDTDKQSKQRLLSDTQGSEANYQRLLAAAKAQLAGFAKFVTSQGGGILPPQPSPDGWFYNQRDERWGNNGIGTSGEPVWKYGCLLTSVAMVLKQRGENVTPAEIAGNSSYFFSAYMLAPWLQGRFTSIWNNDTGAIDSRLSSGKPVIVGLNAGQYGTHFVVLKSGSGGNYIMNDPWYGPDLDFNSHYSVGQIFQYGYLN